MKTRRAKEKPAPFSQRQPNPSAVSAALQRPSCRCGTDTSLSLVCLPAHPRLLKTLLSLAKRPLWPICKKTGNLATWGTGRDSTSGSTSGSPVGWQSGRKGARLTQCFQPPPKSCDKSTYTLLQTGCGQDTQACPCCQQDPRTQTFPSGTKGLISRPPWRHPPPAKGPKGRAGPWHPLVSHLSKKPPGDTVICSPQQGAHGSAPCARVSASPVLPTLLGPALLDSFAP